MNADMISRADDVDQAELDLFRKSFRTFCEREVAPHRDLWREQGMVSHEVWRKAGEAGFLMVSSPAEMGGMGGNYRHEVVIMEELARINFLDFNIHLHNAVVAPYVYAYGSAEQIERWLPRMMTGELIGAIGMSEPGAGSDLRGLRTTARREGDEYVISGQKTFISNGQLSNFIIVACKTEGSERSGLSMIAVETDKAPGFRRGKKLHKIGLHAQDTSELFFDEVRVPASNLLGEQSGRGLSQMMTQLPQERLTVAVQGVAIMECALAATLEYVKERQAFGKRLIEFQNTRFVLASVKTETEIARIYVDNCIDRLVRGELDQVQAAQAKLWVSDRQNHIIDECLQLFGGYGYILDYPIARMWADARIQRIYGGSNEIMKEIIGRTL